MGDDDPIDELFGGMGQLGPGGDAYTLHVLTLLPTQHFQVVVDAGCGTGRQTLALARALETIVHAVDSHEPFLRQLVERARAEALTPFVRAHCMDMRDMGAVFRDVDLLWSEGAAYNIGFADALAVWASLLREGGIAVVSELSWLEEDVADDVRAYFREGYPAMRTMAQNLAIAAGAGYTVLATYVLPRDAWIRGYYDVLGPRARALLEHPASSVRNLAADTLREIEVFDAAGDSYGYVFYILRR